MGIWTLNVPNDNGYSDKLYLNGGAGVFTDSGQSLGGTSSNQVILADFDLDGDLDAYVASNSNQANKVMINNGSGVFADSGQNLGTASTHSIAAGDFDQDGDLDVFAANA